LTERYSGRQSSRLLIAGDEFHVLNTAAVGNRDGADDGSCVQFPKAESVSVLDTERRFQDGDRDDEVGCQHHVVLEIDAQTMGRELLAQNVESSRDVFGPLVNNVEVGVRLDESAG